MKRAITAIASIIQSQVKTKSVPRIVAGEQYASSPIDEKSFRDLSAIEPTQSFVWIDGGIGTLFTGAGLHCSALRISCVFSTGASFETTSYLFILVLDVITDTTRLNAQTYRVRLHPLDDHTHRFTQTSDMDTLFVKDIAPAELLPGQEINGATIANAVRSLLELFVARSQAKLHQQSVIVLDGTLRAYTDAQQAYLAALFSATKMPICAVAKTSRISLESGESVLAYLSRSKKGMWCVCDALHSYNQRHQASIVFARLHEKANHVFRIDIHDGESVDSQTILSNLAWYATDPVFLGYPYPLIKVDGCARVSDEESQMLSTQLLANLSSETRESVLRDMNSVDAHDVLDAIRF